MSKLVKLIKNPLLVVPALGARGGLNWMPDEWYLKLCYKARLGCTLNLESPRTYNEKLQWLKLNDRNPAYTELVDKYAVKKWVKERIGGEYLPETYGCWLSVDDIDIDSLPDRFVLKTNHDSGGVAICSNRDEFDFESAKKKLKKHLSKNYYTFGREWPYRDVVPCVFAEEYLEEADLGELPDYKFFCFDGKAKAMFLATERMTEDTETKFDFFDMDFNHLPFTNGHPNADKLPDKPDSFDEMKRLSEKLSEGIPHVRVDFYQTQNGIYFGEMTFFHWSGFVPFEPNCWDETFGAWINLPSLDA